MQLIKEIANLVRKELLIEWRQRYAIGGILLYVVSTVFIIYTSFIQVNPRAWNALFWIVLLFASVNAVTKSFVQENSNRQLYYYSLANPTAVILSKIFYNTMMLLIIAILSFAAFVLVAGNPVKNITEFCLAILLGSLGFSITLTFISAIASKANNSATLMAILSFPVVIPMLMTLIKISANALGLINDTSVWKDMLVLVAIDSILIGLSFILFPFLWRD